jgi:hypothetical protein
MVVFETTLSENWFGGYLAIDSISHGGGEGCETLPREAAKTTVPPETTTTPAGKLCPLTFIHRYEIILSSLPPNPSPYVHTVSHLNWLSALPSCEGKTAGEGGQIVFQIFATII